MIGSPTVGALMSEYFPASLKMYMLPSAPGRYTVSPTSVGEAQNSQSSFSAQTSFPVCASKQVTRPLLLD